jgi:hypothetical protein
MTKKSMLTFLYLLARDIRPNGIIFAILVTAIAGNCAPSIDFKAPALGNYCPITGHVSGLDSPSAREVILLDSQKIKSGGTKPTTSTESPLWTTEHLRLHLLRLKKAG